MAFAARLDVLLAEVPVVPGGTARFGTEDVVRAVAAAVDGGPGREARDVARAWLAAARGPQGPSPVDDRPALAALGALFRVPPEYFSDDAVARAVQQGLRVAREAGRRGFTVVGPCRTRPLPPAAVADITANLLRVPDDDRDVL
ncbi:hypothetical protein GCM10023200_39780 [Actinomycetospora chlora]|uniref:Uncharacterized protein n=1 Tax=Actinomycetospora chlora TaxID=663608 RepID=A0ABP9BQF4_9PSEU